MGIQGAVVLLSGGLDSATCLALASQNFEVHAITFDYGSRHSREVDSARALARHFNAKSHTVLKIGLDSIGGSALTDSAIPVETGKRETDIGRAIPSTYVPARNMIFMSIAIAKAEAIGASCIFIGANSVDYSGYPDCRPEFIAAFQDAAKLGTRAGVEGHPIRVEAPLLRMSKSEIVRKGAELNVPFELTWTCYSGGESACGKCEACTLRLAGFREAGMDDPIGYQD
jgi:7-cyano-7-deazaguanine synthase